VRTDIIKMSAKLDLTVTSDYGVIAYSIPTPGPVPAINFVGANI
jgi:hypothetical protein